MSNTESVTVTEIQNNKVLCSWVEPTLAAAIAAVDTLKISGVGKTYSIESKGGTVLEVIRK